MKSQEYRGAIGGRTSFGWESTFYGGGEVSLQINRAEIRRWELNLGFAGTSSTHGTKFITLHQWKLLQNSYFNAYLGTGAGVVYINEKGRDDSFNALLAINAGIDYTFAFPIQIALDWRPEYAFGLDEEGKIGSNLGLALRFAF